MNVPDLLSRVGEWVAVVEITADDQVILRECSEHTVPPELLQTLREHKPEIARHLAWERAADALWRAVFGRLAKRADLAEDSDFQALLALADSAHLRQDRKALVDALLDIEAYAGVEKQEHAAGDPVAVTR